MDGDRHPGGSPAGCRDHQAAKEIAQNRCCYDGGILSHAKQTYADQIAYPENGE